jgi:WD40 repeat protein
MAIDKAGRWLVTVSVDKTARVWSLPDGRLFNTLRLPIGSGNEGKVFVVALSPDGQAVALGVMTNENDDSFGNFLPGATKASGKNYFAIYLFDRASGRMIRRLADFPTEVTNLAFSPDGKSLAVVLDHAPLRIISVSEGHLLSEGVGWTGYLQRLDMDFSSDGRLVFAGNMVSQFNGKELTLPRELGGGGLNKMMADAILGSGNATKKNFGTARIARFSPDGKYIAVGYANTSNVTVYNSSDLSLAYQADTAGVSGVFSQVAWSQQGDFLYAAASAPKNINGVDQNYIRRWSNQGRGQSVDLPVGSKEFINGLSALPDGKIVYVTASLSWGVINDQGKKTSSHDAEIADFQEGQQSFALSANGAQIGFGFERGGKSLSVFDVQQRDFFVNTQKLVAPVIEAAGISVTDWKYSSAPKLNGTQLVLYPSEKSASLALLPSGNEFVLGTTHRLRLFESDRHKRWQQPIPGTAWAVNASKDGRWIVAAFGDGTIRWYRASDGVEQLAFFPHADKKRWIMWTPEGYYDASPGGEDLIGWHLNQGKDKEAHFIPSGQLYDVFFRPDIVQAKFRGEDISDLITITAAQALKNPPPILSFTKVPSTTKSNTEKVCYKAVATGGGIGEVRLFQNGKLIKSDGFYRETVAKSSDSKKKLASNDSATVTRALKLTKTAQKSEPPMMSNSKGNEYSECQEIETIPGDNEISVAAFNGNNTIQSSLEAAHFTADRKAEDPHLYVLGIGINQYQSSENNLKYAVKDATDFRTMIKTKADGLFNAQNIHIEGLNDAVATKAGIQKAIEAISAKVKPWDSFILFVASHGYLQDNQYYIVTSDFDGVIDTTKMISSNEIVGMSKNIKSLSQLLIFDTCHAGGVDNIIGGLYDARMSVMAKKMGLHIFASAGSTQTALDGYQGNGLFTHALLDSMKAGGTTDINHDKEVSVAELGESAKQETMDISKKLGFPQSPNIINFGKDNALFRVK